MKAFDEQYFLEILFNYGIQSACIVILNLDLWIKPNLIEQSFPMVLFIFLYTRWFNLNFSVVCG